MRPAPDKDEQTDAERLEVARRYREQHGRELRAVGSTAVAEPIVAIGEFDTVPTEAIASVPILGAFLALFMRLRYARRKLPASVMLALTEGEAVLLSAESTVGGETVAREIERWPRDRVRVAGVERRFMRDEVRLDLPGEEGLRLFAPRLRLNPWGSEVVRRLGGEAPEPMPLD